VPSWCATGRGPTAQQELTGEIGAPASSLVFFTIATLGSAKVVSAYLSDVRAS
jgi:hypothetical protein